MVGKMKWSKKKRVLFSLIALTIIVSGFVGFKLVSQSKSQNSNGEIAITAGKDEEIIYANLTAVVGNDISCHIEETKETKEYQIPVGTPITTRLGTVTTFSKLSDGDQVAILLQKGTDIIKAVWLM